MTITIKKDLHLTTKDVSNSNILALTATYVPSTLSIAGWNETGADTYLDLSSGFCAGQPVISGAPARCLPVPYFSVRFPQRWRERLQL